MYVSDHLQVRKNTVCVGIILLSNLPYMRFPTKPQYCEKGFTLNGAVHALYVCIVGHIRNLHSRDINRDHKLEFFYKN